MWISISCLLLAAVAGTSAPPPVDDVVMTVSGRKLTAAELEQAIENLPPPQQSGFRQQPMRAVQWLGRLLALSEEARRRGLGAPASGEKLGLVDEANGRASLLIQQIAGRVPRPTAAQIESYWKAHAAELARPLSEVGGLIETRLKSARVDAELDRIVARSHLAYDTAALDRFARSAGAP
jgi:hypothetical protein